MLKSLPSVNALRALEAVARLGQFTKAADELCVTHGAVSKQIKQLEELYGAQIFIRSTNGMQLTDKGVHIHAKVLEVLASLEASFNTSVGTELIGDLALSVPPRFLANWLVPRLNEFCQQYPGYNLHIDTSHRSDVR